MLDVETRLLVAMLQRVSTYQEDFKGKAVGYIERHSHFISAAGRVLQEIGLAKTDRHAPLGWRPTRG
jgi:hypothetical protein